MHIRSIFKLASNFLILAEESSPEYAEAFEKFGKYADKLLEEFDILNKKITGQIRVDVLSIHLELNAIKSYLYKVSFELEPNSTNNIAINFKSIQKILNKIIEKIDNLKNNLNDSYIKSKPNKSVTKQINNLINKVTNYSEKIKESILLYEFYSENKKTSEDLDWRSTETTPENYYAL